MSRIFWDTNLFVYLIEDKGETSKRVAALAESMHRRNDVLYASTMTLGELLVRPMQAGNEVLQRQYEEVLSRHAGLIPFDEEAARIFAAIRCDRSVKPPDAIQLACAAKANVDLFITNDERLSQQSVRGIKFVTSLHRAPL